MKTSAIVTSCRLVAPALVLVFSGVAAFGQASAVAKAATLQGSAFYDEKIGINTLVKAQAALEAEFKSRKDDLDQKSAKINALNKEIADLKAELPNLDAANRLAQQGLIDSKTTRVQAAITQGQILQKESQVAYELREKELVGPIMDEISKAIETFAKSHDIDVLIDLSKYQGVYFFSTPPDITAAFIADFNARHPAR